MMTKKQQTLKNAPIQNSNLHHNTVRTSSTPSISKSNETKLTRIIINYDVGFNNSLYIRGQGANLSWEKGIQLKNIKSDEWVWETECAFANAEFKILINDKTFETGQNHSLQCGSITTYKPQF